MSASESGEAPVAAGAPAETSQMTSPTPDTLQAVPDVRKAKSPYLCVEDVAARYHSSARTIREAARLGQLPHLRRSNSRRLLFLESELDALDSGAELELSEFPDGGRRVAVKTPC